MFLAVVRGEFQCYISLGGFSSSRAISRKSTAAWEKKRKLQSPNAYARYSHATMTWYTSSIRGARYFGCNRFNSGRYVSVFLASIVTTTVGAREVPADRRSGLGDGLNCLHLS